MKEKLYKQFNYNLGYNFKSLEDFKSYYYDMKTKVFDLEDLSEDIESINLNNEELDNEDITKIKEAINFMSEIIRAINYEE